MCFLLRVDGRDGHQNRKKASLHRSGKKSSPGDSGSLFVVEIVLKERDSRGKNNDPVIKDRIKLWLTLCHLGLWVYSAKSSQQGNKTVWSFRNRQQIRVQKDTWKPCVFLPLWPPFLSEMPPRVKGNPDKCFSLRFQELWRHTGYQTGNLQRGGRGGWLCISSG